MFKLGDYVKIKTGKLNANASVKNGKYPFFTCSKENLFIDKYSYDCECVLVAGNGDLNVKYYNGKFNAYQRTYIIESNNKNILNVQYLYYFLNNYIEKLRDSSIGGVIKYIRLENLTDVKINIIPLKDQINIITILSKINRLIDIKYQQLELMNQFISSLFIEMFGDPIKNPMNWNKEKLENKCQIITGNTPSRKIDNYYGNYIEWIKSDNIDINQSIITKAVEYLSEKGLKVGRCVDNNSILMTCIAGSIKCIGNVAITNRKVAFNQQINAIVPNNQNVWFMYIQFKICQQYIQGSINMSLKGILSKSRLSELLFIFPPMKLQNQFAERVQQIDKSKFADSYITLISIQNNMINTFFS